MTARQSRLDIIKDIISDKEIGSQEELLSVLAELGHKLTQATLSRDLKLLKVVKGNSPQGKSIYMLPTNQYYQRVREHHVAGTAVRNGFMSIRYTGNLAVIKTRPGYASGLALDIDNAHFAEVIGTIAGDDTIMLALEEGYDRNILEANLRTIVPVYPGSRL
ncbi:MAG: arginine repressor [Bacteroidaceae bacterium]|jgi:transcriptional regulator of arginine metabolism|nr:arginine repressor [Bacteroidaceae bacterium]